MQIKHIVGIDPGLKGAIAIYNTYEQTIEKLVKTPVNEKERTYLYSEIVDLLSYLDPSSTFCILEKQHCMPGEGLPRTFKTGFGFGMFVGILSGLRLSFDIVMAREWQKKVLLGWPKTMPIKERSIKHAKRFFKLEHLHRTDKSYTDHDGLADALNMTLYKKMLIEDPVTDKHIHRLNSVNVCTNCGDYVV